MNEEARANREEIERMNREATAHNEALLENHVWKPVFQDDEEFEDSCEVEEADDPQAEINAIRQDKAHPYNNPKASREEHQEAVDRVNYLIGRTHRRR